VIPSELTAFVNSLPSHGSSCQLRSRVRLGPFQDKILEIERQLEIMKESQANAEAEASVVDGKEIQAAKANANLLTWAARTCEKQGMPNAAAMRAKADAAVAKFQALKRGAPAAARFKPSKALSSDPVTHEDVVIVQTKWADAIKRISKTYMEKGDYVKVAADAAGELYAYGQSGTNVLFKPTKASVHQFRPTPESAMSYFVGHSSVDGGFAEDHGFAINGGKGWSDVAHENHQIEIKGDVAVAMGNYYFTCATTGGMSRVEYTFGYQRCEDGQVRIFLHHSSMPYAL